MKRISIAMAAILLPIASLSALAQDRPKILLIVSDDTGYGDLGVYGGGEGRGMQTPNFDRLADEGMTLYDFYAQPSCTPGRGCSTCGPIRRSAMTSS